MTFRAKGSGMALVFQGRLEPSSEATGHGEDGRELSRKNLESQVRATVVHFPLVS